MSEYNYLTGRKELFDEAPPEAMVVLETNDGQLYYAVSHNRGAKYWYSNGNPGRPIGLIALFEKTRVIASRALVGSMLPVKPKRDPIPKSRLDRMEQAQKTLRKAVSQPAPVAPKPEPKPAPKPVMKPAIESAPVIKPKAEPVKWTEADIARLDKAIDKVRTDEAGDGFVSIFALSTRPLFGEAFATLHHNGNIGLSSKVPVVAGDQLDVQIDQKRGLFRVGKVKTGGRVLPKSRMVTSKALTGVAQFPKDAKSVRIELSEVDGWWQGFIQLKGGAK